jgi:hypothetical protein
MNKTEEKNTDTENENTDKKRALLIKLMSSFVNSDEEELMNAFDNQDEMPWTCGK